MAFTIGDSVNSNVLEQFAAKNVYCGGITLELIIKILHRFSFIDDGYNYSLTDMFINNYDSGDKNELMEVKRMGKYDGIEGITKRTMILFFLIDKSFSMGGAKIGAVNYAIRDVIPEIREIAEDSADANIKISVLTFSSGAEWLYQTPIEAKDFQWIDINVDGMTDMGYAFRMLNEKLSRNSGFMTDVSGSYAPVIFLMSDGQPTDEYIKPLNDLKNNNWFKSSIKAAVAIGDDADKNMLAEFTGNPESVLIAHTPEALKKIIRFVSVTTSKIGSKSSNAPLSGQSQSKQDDFDKQIIDFNDSLIDSQYDDWN